MRSLLVALLVACTPASERNIADTGLPVDSAVPVAPPPPAHAAAVDTTVDVVVSDPTRLLPDPEFEPGGARIVWQDALGRGLWTATVDLQTGDLSPRDGRGVRVDRDVGPTSWSRNGPEWVSSATGSRVIYVDRDAAGRSVLAQAWQEAGTWRSAAVPDSTGFTQPFGTQVPGDVDPLVRFRSADVPPRTGLLHLDAPADRFVMTIELASARFGPGLRTLTGVAGRQVWEVDEDGTRTRLTTDTGVKAWPFLVRAPERGGELLLVAARARGSGSAIVVWRRIGGSWSEVRSVAAPSTYPWIDSPEPFVWNGRTYAVFVAMQGTTPEARTPSEVWVVSLDPASPSFARRVCGPDVMERRDPEFFGGARPWAWYTEATGDRRILHRCEVPLP